MHPLDAVGERKKLLKSEVAVAFFVKLKQIVTQKLLPLKQHRVQVNLKERIGKTTTSRMGGRREEEDRKKDR